MSPGDPLHALDAASRAAARDHVSRLKHDLGKYVSLQVRWLPPDADADARRGALTADLLSTRRGPAGEQDAQSVWGDFRPGLVGDAVLVGGVRVDLTGDPDLTRLDEAMTIIVEVSRALRAGTTDPAVVARGEAAARVVAEACRTLYARLRTTGG